MKRFWSERTILERCEFVAAISLSLLLVAFHIFFFLRAGPLWRDEISSLSLATKSSFSEFWQSLRFDPFPASYFLLLRAWNAIGFGGSIVALRGLGLLISISLIGALWLSCYVIDKSPPLWPLALFSFNSLVLEGGDSLRPYGFGLIWIVLAFGLIWRITFGEFEKRTVLFALIAALLSVQSLFTNAFMLLAVGAGATLVLLMRESWGRIALIIGVGLIAAVTLLPYLPSIHATADWSEIIANNNDIGSVVAVGRDAIAEGGLPAYWIWLGLSSALSVTLLVSVWPKLATVLRLDREPIIFAGTTLLISAAAMIGFLMAARYLVYPRYFLPALAVVALCLHLFWHALPNRVLVWTFSLVLGLFVAATSLPPLYARANMRMTNCDAIAATLEQRSDANDFIIVTSFLYGISFQRYYHGKASWMALPQLDDLSLHRWDLLKQAMAQPDPVPALVSRAETALRGGRKIFLVGKLGPPLPEQPEPLPPAPQTELGWQMEPYVQHWKAELTYWIEHHAIHGNELPIDDAQIVNPLERLGAFEVSGWRED